MQFRKLTGGLYALYPFYDMPEKLTSAYHYIFGDWLPKSIYQADNDKYNLEFNMNNPAEAPEGKCKVNLYAPIKQRSDD